MPPERRFAFCLHGCYDGCRPKFTGFLPVRCLFTVGNVVQLVRTLPIPNTVTAYPLRVGSFMHTAFSVKEAFRAEPNAPSTSCYLRTWKDCRRFGPKRNTAK
jgi:hypothetical protein